MLGSEAELFETVININDDMQKSIARYLNMMTIRRKKNVNRMRRRYDTILHRV